MTHTQISSHAKLAQECLTMLDLTQSLPGDLEAVKHATGEARRRWRIPYWDAERLRLSPDDVRARYLGANALVALGERAKGLQWARAAQALDPDEPMLLYNVGCIYAMAGEREEALECLERAAGSSGIAQREWFEHDSNLDSLREEPRFQAILDALS